VAANKSIPFPLTVPPIFAGSSSILLQAGAPALHFLIVSQKTENRKQKNVLLLK